MSIYTNSIYGNPTTIPYTKLKAEDKPWLLQNLISINPSQQLDNYRRQHRITSAVIILTCTAVVLTAFGVFGRCFQTEDSDAEDFERFMHMIEPRKDFPLYEEPLKPLDRGPYSRRILPFPKKPFLMPGKLSMKKFEIASLGPVIPSSGQRAKHAQCPVMSLIDCGQKSFDGYSLEENQQRVDLKLGKEMLSGRLNTSYAVNMARIGFKQCVKNYDGDKASIIKAFVEELYKTPGHESATEDSAQIIADLVAHYRLKYGVNVFLKVDVGAKYLSSSGNQPYIMYLDQELLPDISVGHFALMHGAFQTRMNEADIQKVLLNVPRIREMVADSDNSASWKAFTAAEARARWPFFDFATYLSRLNEKHKFTRDLDKFTFVVKAPYYFDQLNSFFLLNTNNKTTVRLDLFNLLSLYTVFADYDKYFGIEGVKDKLRKKYRLQNSPPINFSQPYHLIHNYPDGQASFEALSFCSAELRSYLPHIASALYADFASKSIIKDRIQQFKKLIEVTRNELISWINENKIEQRLKDVLAEKLQRVGVSFTSHESLEKESFEETHRFLNLNRLNGYIQSVADIRNFLFKRKLDRLNSKVEALRSFAFAESSVATINIKYSRQGNWLNVPVSMLTMPIFSSRLYPPRVMIYSNMFWMIGRELSKAIDSEGILYNMLGMQRPVNESDLNQLEQLWTDSQGCLAQSLHNIQFSDTTKDALVRQSINEMIGFEIAYRSFVIAMENLLGKPNPKARKSKMELSNSSLESFFQSSASVYCKAPQRGASISLLDKFVDTFVKQNNVLGCRKEFTNADCDLQLSMQ